MRTHNTGFVSSIPPCVPFKTPLVRKAKGNHIMNSTSLGKLRALSRASATLEIEYATQFLQENENEIEYLSNQISYHSIGSSIRCRSSVVARSNKIHLICEIQFHG